MRQAITAGRYAVVTRAHLATIFAILHNWTTVTIGVLDLELRPSPSPDLTRRHPEFYRLCDSNCDPSKNPLSVAERLKLWQGAIRSAQLQDRVRVEPAVRPELDPIGFNASFPPNLFDMVLPDLGSHSNEFDRQRTSIFESILSRKIYEVKPRFVEHTSTIREAVKNGASLEGYLAPGTYSTFMELDAAERHGF